MELTGVKHGCSEDIHQHPHIPWGTSCFLFLDVSIISGRHFLCPIPTGLAMSMQANPLLWDWGGPASWRGSGGVESILPSPRGSVAKLRRGAPPIWPSFAVSPFVHPSSPSRRGYPDGERIRFSPNLQQLYHFNQARIQLECELGQEAQELTHRYNDCQIKLAKKHKKMWAKMTQEGNTTFQEIFSMVSSTDLIKLLSGCVSSTVPFCYMNKALATAMQQGKNVPTTAAATEAEGSLTLGPSSSLAHPSGNPPLVPFLPDIPFVCTPPVGCSFPEFIAGPSQKK